MCWQLHRQLSILCTSAPAAPPRLWCLLCSGLGYITGSSVKQAAGDWHWALRVRTPPDQPLPQGHQRFRDGAQAGTQPRPPGFPPAGLGSTRCVHGEVSGSPTRPCHPQGRPPPPPVCEDEGLSHQDRKFQVHGGTSYFRPWHCAGARLRQDLGVGAGGLEPLPVPQEDSAQVLTGPRTVQSEETEIASLAEERKLKTKCFFLKSRKEAASVEFLDGWGVNGEELPAHGPPGQWGVGTHLSLLTSWQRSCSMGTQAPEMCPSIQKGAEGLGESVLHAELDPGDTQKDPGAFVPLGSTQASPKRPPA